MAKQKVEQTTSLKRTLAGLMALFFAMTAGAGLLLVLDPPPKMSTSPVKLLAEVTNESPMQMLTTPSVSPSNAWEGIVIRDSGGQFGSMAGLERLSQQTGASGLGYHFVVDNGQGAPDGQIEVSNRWSQQQPGRYATGEYADWYNNKGIGICYIGNADLAAPTAEQVEKLLELVQELQTKFNISADKVYIQTGQNSRGGLFPMARFRQQLLAIH